MATEVEVHLVISCIGELRPHIGQLRLHLQQLMARSLVLLVIASRPTHRLVAFRLQNRFSSRVVFEQSDFSPQKLQMQIASLNLFS